MGSVQSQGKPVQSQMQGGLPSAGTTGLMGAGGTPRPCSFRVSHSSGETICGDLETAKALQRQKPGAKIFLERHD